MEMQSGYYWVKSKKPNSLWRIIRINRGENKCHERDSGYTIQGTISEFEIGPYLGDSSKNRHQGEIPQYMIDNMF